MSQPRCRSGSPATEPSGQVAPPGPHPAEPSSPLGPGPGPGGERWPIPRPLGGSSDRAAAQLVCYLWVLALGLGLECPLPSLRGTPRTAAPPLWPV
jgi:hypothetical protein